MLSDTDAKFLRIAYENSYPRMASVQNEYSLLCRLFDTDMAEVCHHGDVGLLAFSPLAAGLLTGKYASGGRGRLTDDGRYAARYGLAWMSDAGAALAELAASVGQHPATLAVAWAARHPGVTAPIISARSAEQLAPSLAAFGFPLTDDLYAQMSADFAVNMERFGPYWEKPEIYREQSPHYYAANFNTPSLVIHGQNDLRVPVGQGFELFRTLQTRGVDSKLIYYPDENHWILKRSNSLSTSKGMHT